MALPTDIGVIVREKLVSVLMDMAVPLKKERAVNLIVKSGLLQQLCHDENTNVRLAVLAKLTGDFFLVVRASGDHQSELFETLRPLAGACAQLGVTLTFLEAFLVGRGGVWCDRRDLGVSPNEVVSGCTLGEAASRGGRGRVERSGWGGRLGGEKGEGRGERGEEGSRGEGERRGERKKVSD